MISMVDGGGVCTACFLRVRPSAEGIISMIRTKEMIACFMVSVLNFRAKVRKKWELHKNTCLFLHLLPVFYSFVVVSLPSYFTIVPCWLSMLRGLGLSGVT